MKLSTEEYPTVVLGNSYPNYHKCKSKNIGLQCLFFSF